MGDIAAKLNHQINKDTELLRSYIHEMDTFIGNGAHMIQDLFMLKEEVKYLYLLLEANDE